MKMTAVRVFLFACTMLMLLGCSRTASTAATRPSAARLMPGPRVVIISIDGMRPDILLRAEAPNIRALMKQGSFTMWARTTEVSITLPSHTSMLTGIVPDRHGIWWNGDPPPEFLHYPHSPTIFEIAKKKGYTTALAAGKSKFFAFLKAGTVDWSFVPKDYERNLKVAGHAVEFIRNYAPQVLMVHFPDTDEAGHRVGWGTEEQLKAMGTADQAVGMVVQALKERGVYERTYIIISADHGGAAKSHGAEDPRSRHIPWIFTGPNVRKNYDLTAQYYLTVNTEDTFATACYVMNMPRDGEIDGKAILQAFESKPIELLQDVADKPEKPTTNVAAGANNP